MSLCHIFGNSPNFSNVFIIILSVMVICDQSYLMLLSTIDLVTDSLKAQMVAFFQQYFLIQVHTLLF